LLLAGCLLLAADMGWAQSRPYFNAVQNPVPNATASSASTVDSGP
jgi:hypothetical protein